MRLASPRARPAALDLRVAEVGRRTEERWRRSDYDDQAFPGIAVEMLSRWGDRALPDPWEILEWCASAGWLPQQADPSSHFGDLSLTLYSGARFHLAAYFWLDGSTAIHQHQFAGAFRVLAGSSFHSRYRFRVEQRVSSHMRLGRLTLEDVELLERGDVRPIAAGDRLIHSLFHLDRPSVTLCLRTNGDPDAGPQWGYHWPGVALDPFFEDPAGQKLDQAVSVVLAAKYPGADAYLRAVLARSDLQTAYQVLSRVFFHQKDGLEEQIPALKAVRNRWPALVDVARRRHGDRVDRLLAVLEEQVRMRDLAGRRGAVTRPEHRFLLALLINVRRRADVLSLVARAYGGRDPAATIAGWVEELAATKVFGSREPNVLGIPDCGPEYIAVLSGLLAGRSEAAILAGLKKDYPDEDPAALREEVARTCRSIRESLPFRALLGRA